MHIRSIRLPAFDQRGVFALVLAVFTAAAVPYALKAQDNGSAFVRWHNQIEQVFTDADIYQQHGYPNPPMMALVLYPLTLLPPAAGALCWYALKAGMALAALFWTFRLVESAERPLPVWAQLLVALLCLRPFLGDLSHGNVNLFVLFLVVGCLYALTQGHDVWAGLTLALAIACKVTPLLFVPYFLWKRAWKLLAGCALGLVLFFAIIPGLCLGWARNTTLLDSWTTQMLEPYLLSGRVFYTEHNNQSLPAVVMRLTTASPSFSTYVDGRHTPVSFFNLVDWTPDAARWLIRACLLAFAGLIVWTCRSPLRDGPRWRPAAEFALVLLGMLLFSERTWKHHCVLIVLPYAVVVYYLAQWQPTRWQAGFLIGALTLAQVLIGSTSTGLLPDQAAKLAQVYGACAWAHVVLVAALAVVLRSSRFVVPPSGGCSAKTA